MPQTYKDKFNKKYGFSPDQSHSIKEIAKLTGYQQSGLQTILEKGQGAFFSNPSSVRPSVTDPTHWGYARVYSAVMGGATAKIDAIHLVRS
jgi:hypothetical protein